MRKVYLHVFVNLATMRLSWGDAHELQGEVFDIFSGADLNHGSRRETQFDLVLLEIVVSNVDRAAVIVDESLTICAVSG